MRTGEIIKKIRAFRSKAEACAIDAQAEDFFDLSRQWRSLMQSFGTNFKDLDAEFIASITLLSFQVEEWKKNPTPGEVAEAVLKEVKELETEFNKNLLVKVDPVTSPICEPVERPTPLHFTNKSCIDDITEKLKHLGQSTYTYDWQRSDKIAILLFIKACLEKNYYLSDVINDIKSTRVNNLKIISRKYGISPPELNFITMSNHKKTLYEVFSAPKRETLLSKIASFFSISFSSTSKLIDKYSIMSRAEMKRKVTDNLEMKDDLITRFSSYT